MRGVQCHHTCPKHNGTGPIAGRRRPPPNGGSKGGGGSARGRELRLSATTTRAMRRVVELRRGARPAGSGKRSMATPKAPAAPIARSNWRRGRRRGRSDRVTQVGLRRAGRPARRYCSGRRTSYTTSSRLLPEGRRSRLAGGGNAPRRAPPPPERQQHLRHGLVDPQETGGEHRHSRLARISRVRPVWRWQRST